MASLGACAGPVDAPESLGERAGAGNAAAAAPAGWNPKLLLGKRATLYSEDVVDGMAVVRAEAIASASLIRRPVPVDAGELGAVRFSWRVPYLIVGADLSEADSEDSPVRVVLAFDGDRSKLSAKNRLAFELVETMSGEAPPYATLMYVWDAHAPPETVILGGRSDRVRKLVVDSGAAHLNTWRMHERQVVADFRRAFGEEPGALIGIGLMTDSDNTGGRALAWYGAVQVTDVHGRAR